MNGINDPTGEVPSPQIDHRWSTCEPARTRRTRATRVANTATAQTGHRLKTDAAFSILLSQERPLVIPGLLSEVK